MAETVLNRKQSSTLTVDTLEEERIELENTWANPKGFFGKLASVDHKVIGLRTVITAFVFFGMAGILALFMRLQLMKPENNVLGPDQQHSDRERTAFARRPARQDGTIIDRRDP
jgi:hypothetical protein